MGRVLNVRTVVRVIVNAAQHQTLRQGTEEQVLVRVRVGACGYGIDFVVDGTHRILESALIQGLDVRHMYGRDQGCFLREQDAVDDADIVLRIPTASR